jgi:hypothetical protein
MTHIATAKAIMGGAIEQIGQNTRAIARHIGPAYLMWVVVTIALQSHAYTNILDAPLNITSNEGQMRLNLIVSPYSSVWMFAISVVIHTALYIYIAVAWHRVALRPDAVRPDAGHLGQYLWRMVQQTFILVVPIIIFVVINVFASVSAITGAIYNEVLWPLALSIESVLNFLFAVSIGWVLLRFGLILPAAAIGHDGYELSASWKDTSKYAWPLVWIALIEAGLWSASAWLVAKAGHLGEGAAFFVDVLTWPLPFLLGLSVLTYLYRGLADDTE